MSRREHAQKQAAFEAALHSSWLSELIYRQISIQQLPDLAGAAQTAPSTHQLQKAEKREAALQSLNAQGSRIAKVQQQNALVPQKRKRGHPRHMTDGGRACATLLVVRAYFLNVTTLSRHTVPVLL